MKILVTGKNGQLGRSINDLIKNHIYIDNSNYSHDFTFVGRSELDLNSETNISNYFKKNAFDIIINCAAFTAVNKAEKHKALANQINHLAVKKLANIAKIQKAKLLHISTDYVFDGENDRPYSEVDPTNPINIYGKTKLAGEQAIQEIMPTDSTIIRTSWVYSKYGNNFVNNILRLAKDRSEINIVSDQIGSPTYAPDLANLIFRLINKNEFMDTYKSQLFHYSNDGEISWYEFAKEIIKIAKVDCKVSPITTVDYKDTTNRPKNTLMSKEKIINKFNINIKCWRTSLGKCIS